ncbi:MAG TPA: hypothetical protein VK335_05170 [Bryobacteraceae bacterium]|nr:hypothetical protein [Bryobacteraceae bacterium]
MENRDEARDKILTEILSDDAEVRSEYIKHFKDQAEAFAESMSDAVTAWRSLDRDIGKNENRAYVSALVYTAITLHVQSMKVFFAGQPVAAGNLFRQVVESIALALLCSHKDLQILQRFMADEYSTNKAIRDLRAQAERIGVDEGAVKAIERAQDFYHVYSHPTRLTIANMISASDGALYVGASFDHGKIEAYTKEVNGRVNLAEVFVSFIEAVKANMAKW